MDSVQLGVLAGDGIGPEVVEAALAVLAAAVERVGGVTLDLRPLPVGWAAIRSQGGALPESTVDALHDCDGWILGPHNSASYPPAGARQAQSQRQCCASASTCSPTSGRRGPTPALPAVCPA